MNRIRKFRMGETKIPAKSNIFPKISIILVGLAVILLLIALSTDTNDFTTAMLIAVSLINFLSGVIIIAFTEPKGIHPKISAMLYPSLITDKAGIFSGLNVYGDAYFIPKSMTDSERTLQFNPAGEYAGFDYNDSVFSTDNEETAGIFSNPSSSALLKVLEEDYSLEIPLYDESENGFHEILKEIFTETTSFCENVKISEKDDEIIIKMINPVFSDGCREIRKESPKCCTVAPCPLCSLVCVIITEYFNKVTKISTIKNDQRKGELLIITKVLPYQSTDEDSGNLN